jgi:hypothetical protein
MLLEGETDARNILKLDSSGLVTILGNIEGQHGER